MKILGVIPARYQSSRFPGKPLVDIMGKSMIQRVYEQASLVDKLTYLVVATDDERIKKQVESFGGNVLLTGTHHLSGTERCKEVIDLLSDNYDICVNIQGDEPFINPEQISLLCTAFKNNQNTDIATLVKKASPNDTLEDPNRVKVVLKKNGEALYFSRSLIPFPFNSKKEKSVTAHYFLHLGIYAYKVDVLKKIVSLSPGNLEKIESLEQLRWLENGLVIQTISTAYSPISIDTPQDLERAIQFLKTGG